MSNEHSRQDKYVGRILNVHENGDGKQRAVLGLENKVKVTYADGETQEINRLPLLSSGNLRLISYAARRDLARGGGGNYKFSDGEKFGYDGRLLEQLLIKIGERINKPVKSVKIIEDPETQWADFLGGLDAKEDEVDEKEIGNMESVKRITLGDVKGRNAGPEEKEKK